MKIYKFIFIILILFSAPCFGEEKTFSAVISGKECHEDSSQTKHCSYEVGKSLLIEIAGVGQNDAAIVFLKSDFDGDYYGKVGVLHGCVIVSNSQNLFDVAFISPKNGKVYREWGRCGDGK